MKTSLHLALAVGLLLVAACGGGSSPDDAQAAYNAGDYEKACLICTTGLESEGLDDATRWRYESIAIKAEAKLGNGEEVVARLDRLVDSHPTQVDVTFYAQMSKLLSEAGAFSGAIEVVEAGKKRFPEFADKFDEEGRRLGVAATQAGDSSAVEQLKALGYL